MTRLVSSFSSFIQKKRAPSYYSYSACLCRLSIFIKKKFFLVPKQISNNKISTIILTIRSTSIKTKTTLALGGENKTTTGRAVRTESSLRENLNQLYIIYSVIMIIRQDSPHNGGSRGADSCPLTRGGRVRAESSLCS